MNDKKLLIVGLDPGTTTGFAVLDIEGNLVHLDSSKQLGLNSLISESVKLGKAILVGTDKSKAPRLIEEFSTKLGARIASPKEDLKVDEKRKITDKLVFDDDHQGDALASALFAYKSAKPLLDKIDFFAKENKKISIKDRIKEIVITKQISIKSAVAIIEKKEYEDKVMEKVVAERKLDEKDYLRLYNKLKDYEAQLKHLRNYSNGLINRISELEKTKNKTSSAKANKKTADFRENRIKSLENHIRVKDKELEHLRKLLRKFNNILANVNDHYILKKLDNLGVKEFDFKNRLLNIRKNDIILVDDPNIASEDVVEFLKERVFVIVNKKPVSRKIDNRLPFILIDSKNLNIDEDKYFGFVDKKQFESEKNKIDWVRKMVEDYRNEKLINR